MNMPFHKKPFFKKAILVWKCLFTKVPFFKNALLWKCPFTKVSIYMNALLYKCLFTKVPFHKNDLLWKCPFMKIEERRITIKFDYKSTLFKKILYHDYVLFIKEPNHTSDILVSVLFIKYPFCKWVILKKGHFGGKGTSIYGKKTGGDRPPRLPVSPPLVAIEYAEFCFSRVEVEVNTIFITCRM